MRVTEIRPSDLDAAQRAAWDGFVRSSAAPSAFMLSGFAAAVGAVRDDARVAVAEDDSGPLAFLPYHRRPMAVARPIGAPFSDQHGPAIRPGAALDVSALLRTLRLSAWSYSAMPAAPEVQLSGPVFSAGSGFAADVGADGAAYLETRRALHKSRFSGFAKRERKAARELGDIALDLDDRDPAAHDAIMAWKRDQFRQTGKHDVLGPDWTRAMFGRIAALRTSDFGVRVATLRLGGRLAAGQINLLGAGVLHSWIVSYDPALSDYAPGVLVMQGLIAGAPSLGAVRVDLGSSFAPYKEWFADPHGEYLEGLACSEGFAGGARRAVGNLWRAAEAAPVRPLATAAGKLRRRGGQIAAVETDLAGRARGVAAALAGLKGQNAGA